MTLVIEMKKIVIKENDANQRIDKYLKKLLCNAPSNFIYKMFRKKDIKINGKKVNEKYILQKDDILEMFLYDDKFNEFTKEKDIYDLKREFKVLYEDQNILIVDKPVGLLVHGDAKENVNTLSHQVLSYLKEKGELDVGRESTFTPGPVHRLDRNTSGIVIFGKTLAALQDLNEMTHEKWLILKNNIEEILSDDTIDGAVVTHGTDTLDETAYFLTLTLNTPKPVVLTGAMRPATATSADGPFNLYQAICLACHGESYNRGVLALFSNTIYSGRDIEKVNNFKIDAFDQRSLGCLGYMQDQEVYFYTQTSKIHTVKSRFNKRIDSIKSVAIAFYYSGADAKILYDLANNHEGIVIAGSGSGNYSQAWLKAIEELSEKGIIFVRSSRISQGIVFDDEIFDPHHLCISSNTLSPQKARVLLMLALTQTHDRDEIREIFLQY